MTKTSFGPPAVTRRAVIGSGLLLGLGAALPTAFAARDDRPRVIRKAIPSTGERIPVVGLGTANQFGRAEYTDLRDVLKRMHELQGTVIDTAGLYRESEIRIGMALQELDLRNDVFVATKLNTPGSAPDGVGGLASFTRSMERLQRVDLLFVHFLQDVDALMPLLLDLKKQRRVRYIGITAVNPPQHAQLADYMRRYPLDFVQVEYSLGDRAAEAEVLPVALRRRIAVMTALPFDGTRKSLFAQAGQHPLPDWAAEFGITSWAQYFLKYVVSHPAVTCAIPGSTKVAHLEDNQAAGLGRLPDARTRRRMEAYWEALAT